MTRVGDWRGRRLRRVQNRLAGPKLLRTFAETHQSPFFVEIGSNDGEQHDHLRPFILSHGWRGLMVEPVPYVFARLQKNYRDVAGVALENTAIAAVDGVLPFFHLAEASTDQPGHLPAWYDAIGSFSRDVVLAHARDIPDVEQRIVRDDVPCLTFESLLRQHAVDHVDLILIDTEGYDWEIVKSLDLAAHRPRLLIYEHFHLEPAVRAQALAHLGSQGYETMEEGFDTWCLRPDPDDRLTAFWRGLRPGVPGVSVHDPVAT